MKLYADPISTTCRPVLLLMAESGAPFEMVFVDLFSGAHMKPEYAAINPSRAVPALADDDFLLTESSAILKYVADKIGSPTYPKDPKKRAKINAMMDWLNTGLYRDFGYGFIYQQIFPHFKHADENVQKAMVDVARERATKWLNILDKDIIGPKNKYLLGDEITIADYFGAGIVTLADIVRSDLSSWPNVRRWLGNMRALPSWDKINEDFNGKFVAAYKGAPFAIL
jgi:glutathione S-transferase